MTGIEHDLFLPISVEPGGDRLDHRRARQHPDLDGIDGEVREDRVDLGCDEVRRHVVDGGDAERVLGGKRRQHARAINPERRKRLQVGLDPGAAARIRTGDRHGDGGHFVHPQLSGVVGVCARLERVRSMPRRCSR